MIKYIIFIVCVNINKRKQLTDILVTMVIFKQFNAVLGISKEKTISSMENSTICTVIAWNALEFDNQILFYLDKEVLSSLSTVLYLFTLNLLSLSAQISHKL